MINLYVIILLYKDNNSQLGAMKIQAKIMMTKQLNNHGVLSQLDGKDKIHMDNDSKAQWYDLDLDPLLSPPIPLSPSTLSLL